MTGLPQGSDRPDEIRYRGRSAEVQRLGRGPHEGSVFEYVGFRSERTPDPPLVLELAGTPMPSSKRHALQRIQDGTSRRDAGMRVLDQPSRVGITAVPRTPRRVVGRVMELP